MDLLEPAPLPAWFAGRLKSPEPVADSPREPDHTRGASAPQPLAVTSVRLSSVCRKLLEWIWPGWLPLGKLCELAGEPGLSKSTLLLDLAARVSSAGIMPDASQGIRGGVCLMSAEDGLEDTILPRLQAAGADLTKIGFFAGYNREPLLLPDHLERIAVRLRDYDARLLLIDPLAAFLARGTSDWDVRRALLPMTALAERLRCTVLWLRHLSGRGRRAPLAPARAGLAVGRDPNNPDCCILAHAKSNLADEQKSLTYRLERVQEYGCCRIAWGERSELRAVDLSEKVSRKEKEERAETQSKFAQARALLESILAGGPMPIAEVRAAARDACVSERTLERAAAALRLQVIVPPGTRNRQGWLWSLANSAGE